MCHLFSAGKNLQERTLPNQKQREILSGAAICVFGPIQEEKEEEKKD